MQLLLQNPRATSYECNSRDQEELKQYDTDDGALKQLQRAVPSQEQDAKNGLNCARRRIQIRKKKSSNGMLTSSM